MLNRDNGDRSPHREPVWSRWDVICAISLVAACLLVSLALPAPGSGFFGG